MVQALGSVPPGRLERSAPPGLVPATPCEEGAAPDRFVPSAEESPRDDRSPWSAAALAAVAVVGVLGGLGAHEARKADSSAARVVEAPLGPWRQAAEAASLARSYDPREGRETRAAYRELHRTLDAARDRAMADLARLGEGAHELEGGGRVVLRRGQDGVVVAHYQGAPPMQVSFRENEPGRITLQQGLEGSRLLASRVGAHLESRRFGYPTDSWDVEGETLVRRTGPRQVRVAPDGEVTLIPENGLATVITPDRNRGERDQVLEIASARLLPDGRREPLPEEVRARLSDSLDGHSPATLRTLVDNGLTFLIVDAKAPPPPGGYPGGHAQWPRDATGKDEAGAYYNQYLKAVVLRPDMLDRGTVVHETAHALDDFGAPDVDGAVLWESDTDPKVQDLFRAYRERSADKEKVWSDYALVNAQEYYAKGFELHEGSPEDRALLQRLDPDFASFVQQRLGQGATPPRVLPQTPK